MTVLNFVRDYLLLITRADFEGVGSAFHLLRVHKPDLKIFTQHQGTLQEKSSIIVLQHAFFIPLERNINMNTSLENVQSKEAFPSGKLP